MKTLNKCRRPAHFWSVIMSISISDFTAVFGITHTQLLHHQSELGGNSSTLLFRVGWFRRKLLVKFRRHQTSYLSHVFSAVNMNSQFDIYFTSRKTQLNIINYIRSKFIRQFQIFRSVGKCQVHIHKAQMDKCWACLIEFSSKYFVSPPSPNSN
jgi:hypothetical protein